MTTNDDSRAPSEPAPPSRAPAAPPSGLARHGLRPRPIQEALSSAQGHLERLEPLALELEDLRPAVEALRVFIRRLERMKELFGDLRLPRRDRPRCGARTRDGRTCRAPAAWDVVNDRPTTKAGRCRMHGGGWKPLSPEGRVRSNEALARARAARAEQAEAEGPGPEGVAPFSEDPPVPGGAVTHGSADSG